MAWDRLYVPDEGRVVDSWELIEGQFGIKSVAGIRVVVDSNIPEDVALLVGTMCRYCGNPYRFGAACTARKFGEYCEQEVVILEFDMEAENEKDSSGT